jgi:tetratricopeptide (TPR) repeat protein
MPMKNFYFLIAVVIFGVQGSLSAQSLVLDYFDGNVDVQTQDNSWKALDIGAKVDPNSTLRISDSGLAELSQGTLKLHLGKDGVYQLSKSLAQAKNKSESKLMGLTGRQISMLLTGSSSGVAIANMGARGAAKGDEEGKAWAGDEAQNANTLDRIKTLMDQQDWKGALGLTETAISSKSAALAALLFDKALILSNLGMAAGAVKALNEADFQPGDPQYMAAALLVGSQGVEAEDFDLVLAKTAEALDLKPETGVSQSLILAQALAWKGKGDDQKANTLLNNVVSLDPKSDPGMEASRLLES